MKYCFFFFSVCGLWAVPSASAQLFKSPNAATPADTVRGTYGPYRGWWDVLHYDLSVEPDIAAKTLSGRNKITFKVLSAGEMHLQLDLQKPMQLDSVFFKGKKMSFERYEQAYLVAVEPVPAPEEEAVLDVYYHGKPRQAVMPPWDGGLIWTRDDRQNDWVSVACQGLGASVWWPGKDHGADEPDRGVRISVTVPAGLVDVSNGTPAGVFPGGNKTTYVWEVKAPINNYSVTMNIGKYVMFGETYNGLSGKLPMRFWFLEQHQAEAKKHLLDEAKEMLRSFEYWFGPYPFYEDGYQLIETPFLGMEHQSGIAYGNKFLKGYLGTDLSGSGWGAKWDYILVHESGHEWFGNNISTKDVADMWVHEGFTTYSEVLFVESRYGKKAADEYARGLRQNILNDRPVIGIYDINREGSGDMYFKGVQIIHTYRQILNDDVKFRALLHEMNRRFGRKTVTTQDVEALMQEYVSVPLKPFFDTYLRTTRIPRLVYEWRKGSNPAKRELYLKWDRVEKGFSIPVAVTVGKTAYRITVGDTWSGGQIAVPANAGAGSLSVNVDPNYYVL